MIDYENPPEPNWEALAAALLNAQRWWEGVESDDDIERRAVRTEAIRIALAVLDTELAGEDDNTMVRTLFENVNRAAFWLSPYFDDPWIKSFCIDPKRAVEMGGYRSL
jgi:hypothetical protein